MFTRSTVWMMLGSVFAGILVITFAELIIATYSVSMW
jgi:hypothetical protein